MFTKKLITSISVITAVLGLIAGIWAFDGHYETKASAETRVELADEKLENFEITVAGAMQRQEVKSDYKFYQFLYDKLTQDIYNIKRQLRRNTDDQELRDDLSDAIRQRNDVKRKLDLLMQEIN